MASLPPVTPVGRRPKTAASIFGRPVGISLKSWLQSAIPDDKSPVVHSSEYRDWSHNTGFFRDDVWHDYCADVMLFKAAQAAKDEVHVWSCGCSSGEELFTAKMVYERWVVPTFTEALGRAPTFVGFGSDRSSSIIQTATNPKSRWTAQALTNVPPAFMEDAACWDVLPEDAADTHARLAREYASGNKEAPTRRFSLTKHARGACTFGVEDLGAEWRVDEGSLEPSSATRLFDVIMCRYSVFLYSDDEASAKRALQRILSRLAPNGVLLLGLTDPLPRGASALLEAAPFPDSWLVGTHSTRTRQHVNAWRLRPKTRPEQVGITDITDPTGGVGAREHLAAACCLQHWRRLLGLKPRFAEEAPRPSTPAYISAASLNILRAKGLDEVAPLAKRTLECAAERQARLDEKRREKEEREVADTRRAADSLRAHLRSSHERWRQGVQEPRPPSRPATRASLGGGTRAPTSKLSADPVMAKALSFLDRMNEQAEARASKFEALQASTYAQYDAKARSKKRTKRKAQKAYAIGDEDYVSPWERLASKASMPSAAAKRELV